VRLDAEDRYDITMLINEERRSSNQSEFVKNVGGADNVNVSPPDESSSTKT
jgi:hypothetical protein